jgi:glycyl-tRNA synthetase
MAEKEVEFKQIIAHCKEYGFVFQSSEIYDGLSAVYDYGPNGVALKNNLKNYWWKSMVQLHNNIVGIDSAIFMHPKTWKASGHIDGFNDPLIDNKDSKKRYRADVLIEEYQDKLRVKIEKEVKKAAKRFGDSFDKDQFLATNPRVLKYQGQIEDAGKKLKVGLENEDLGSIKKLIEDLEIACPVSGSRNWTDVKQFNLMYSTQMNATSSEGDDALYLRPETAQGIFVNYLNVQKTGRMKIPFGIAQIGKAFRNEIVARQFIIRMKEFEQMEMQYFIKPGTELEAYDFWKKERLKWHKSLGVNEDNYRYHDHIKLAHYANAAVDIEYKFPFGFKEVEGIHSRTDFDLSQHQELSGKKLQYFDPEINESYVPYVLETSIGVDRLFLLIVTEALQIETLEGGEQRVVMRLAPALAPYKLAILPLLKKDGLPEKATEIYNDLKFDFDCFYEEKDAIGKRYRRQDAIGTPFCITIDHQTLEDQTVTIRERDTMNQERINIKDLHQVLLEKTSMTEMLKSLS